MEKIWDFDTINEVVPIEAVLEMHGIQPAPERGRGKGWYSIRPDDDTPSAHIDSQRRYGNTIHDFGYGNTFNPLTLTMYLQGCDMKTASQILGEAFNVPPKYTSREAAENAWRLTDFDWRVLGIYPDMVSKNIDFDLEKYGIQATSKYAARYRISMAELQERVVGQKDPSKVDDMDRQRYESILRTRAIPYAYEKRDEYFRRMYADYQLAKAVNDGFEIDKIYRIHQSDYETMAKELSKIESILKRAIDKTSLRFSFRSYRPAEDFAKVVTGEVSFEIGAYSRFDISRVAYQEKGKVFDTVVSLNEYYRLTENGLDNLQVAARQKGDQVKLYFKSADASKVNFLVMALRGKENTLSATIGQNSPVQGAEGKDEVLGGGGVPIK